MGPVGELTALSDQPPDRQPDRRALRVAGGAAALLAALLLVRLAVVLSAEETWLAVHYSSPQTTAEVTRLVVGLPVCAIAVLLLADRAGQRAGGLLLAGGVVWIVPPAVSDLVASLVGGGVVSVDAAMILLGGAAITVQPLTVLLLPFCLLPDTSPAPAFARRWRGAAVPAVVTCVGYGVLWTLGTPGMNPFPNPWSETAPGLWAAGLLAPAGDVLDAVSAAVAACITGMLAHRTYGTPPGGARQLCLLLTAAYPAYAALLLADVWGERWTMAAGAAGGAVWVAVLCLAVTRESMWHLGRDTGHRLSVAFVLTALAAAAVCSVVTMWALFPHSGSTAPPFVAGCSLVAGWAARPVVRRASLAVERAFYGPRARPHEAIRALAVRLQQAPHPAEVPEQICRSAVEDLGLAGATVQVDTSAGPRRLAAVGRPVTTPKEVFVLHHHGQVVGRLEVARGETSTPPERDSDLLSLLADQAGPALAALRLAEEAQAAREKLVLAREEERRRLRREIHDGLGPQLAAVQLRLGTAQACVAPDSPAPAHLRVAAEGLGEALAEVRRITAGLAPAALVERGLLDATETLARRLSTESVRVVVVRPAAPLTARPMAPAVETAAYRIAAEAVTNAVRHSGARLVRITFTSDAARLTVTVTDDGTGLPREPVPGTGLASFAERAEEIGGTTTVSTGPRGTTVQAVLPVTSALTTPLPPLPVRTGHHE
ncbi:sensor histidine kinase [Streptomyces sp. NPDC060366]|uniref:sensor histidine kinase n=1 Tax=Streptomyces sp. NPDC060366 TaxID=3347105 RepID=UPI003669331C